jgi:drug/metabolite transporter (DMT)-like permease
MLWGFLSLLIGQFFANSVVPIGTKIAAPFTGPIIFVFFRFLVGTLVLLIIFLCTKRQKISRKQWKDFAILGFLLMINVLFFTIAINYTTVIMSTLNFAMTPVLVGIGGHYFLGEKFTRQKIIGLLVSFVGLLFLVNQSFAGHEQNVFGQPLGNLLLIIPLIGYSLYILYSRKVLYTNEQLPILTTFLTFAFVTFFLVLVLLLGLSFGQVTIKPFPSEGVWGILIVAIGSVIQYLFLQIGIKKTDAFTASLFQYTGPFIAGAIAIPLLHEAINIQLLLGGFLILVGVFIATTFEQLGKKKLR